MASDKQPLQRRAIRDSHDKRSKSNWFDARDNRDKDNAKELSLKICGSTKKVDKEIRCIVGVYAEKPNEGEEE